MEIGEIGRVFDSPYLLYGLIFCEGGMIVPFITNLQDFISTCSNREDRCLILQKEGENGAVCGHFISEITAGPVADKAVLKSLFDEGYRILKDQPLTTALTMNELPLSHFVGLYPITLVVRRHNSVIDVYDGSNVPIEVYMGVG